MLLILFFVIFFLFYVLVYFFFFFFFQAEDGIRDHCVTGVQTCALPILDRFASCSRAPNLGLPTFWRSRSGIGASVAAGPPSANGVMNSAAGVLSLRDRKSVV